MAHKTVYKKSDNELGYVKEFVTWNELPSFVKKGWSKTVEEALKKRAPRKRTTT